MKNVTLFTPFPPNRGAGAAYFHEAIKTFEQIRVTWAYLGPTPDRPQPGTIHLGPNRVGGSLSKDVFCSSLLWLGAMRSWVKQTALQLANLRADAYWIVPMHETIPVGLELTRNTRSPVHLSIQDDQTDSIGQRSRRYRHLIPLMRRQWLQLAHTARSIDVCSHGMQKYYSNRYSLPCSVFHPYVPHLPAQSHLGKNSIKLTVGHIGSLYSTQEWRAFLVGLKSIALASASQLHLRLVNPSGIPLAETKAILGGHEVEVTPHLEDAELCQLLGQCDFLYSMFPFDTRSEVFRRTSLPSKLATYLKAGRPIFAHTPADSTLATWIEDTALGNVCPSLDQAHIHTTLTQVMSRPATSPQHSEQVRDRQYGRHYADSLHDSLVSLAP